MRPEILFPLFAPSTTLKGVGPKLAPLVEKLAGPLVRDLVLMPPSGVITRRRATVAEAQEGETCTLLVTIDAHLPPRNPKHPYRIRVRDETGFFFLVYFKVFGDNLQKHNPVGAARAVSGKVEWFNGEKLITHPDYLLPAERVDEIPAFEAVYPATAGLPSRTVRRLAWEALERAPELPEWQDAPLLKRERWPSWRQALETLHHPENEADTSLLTPARRRLAYDELLAHQLAMAQRKAARRAEPAPAIPAGGTASKLEAALPFRLTGAQVMALAEIRGDLKSGERMSRLLQGDVGAGKTVVAMLAMADAADAGFQSVLMAPTEILARQHFETLAGPLEAQGVQAILLTGRDKGAVRAEKLRALTSGAASVAVGTHALFQEDVTFNSLALAVIDEQHRFGVNERRRLQEKGSGVHLLAMSATPIPRTLELTLYGDLDVSRLNEKPPGRTPVATRAVPRPRLPEIVERLRQALASGAQAFWICPLVSESEMLDVTAAEKRAASLARALGPGVGLVHGAMAGPDKDAVMADFADNRIKLLVATTVVEVGVNVPNASIMVIEHAERFGLSQLHQLRGRVGRGAYKSYCVLVQGYALSEEAEQRADIMERTSDGFKIAEADLEMRGPGEFIGTRQSGLPGFKMANLVRDVRTLQLAREAAFALIERDPTLSAADHAAIKERLQEFEKTWVG